MDLPADVVRTIIGQERQVVADAKALFDMPEVQGFLSLFGVKPEEMQRLHDRDVAALDAMEKNLP